MQVFFILKTIKAAWGVFASLIAVAVVRLAVCIDMQI